MKLEIDDKSLQTINSDDLFLLVVRPIALRMHSGKGPEHKYDVYKSLTDGQRAAFMYWVLHSHAADTMQFYTWIPYMRSTETDYWNQLKKGLQLIDCGEMLQFMDNCDGVFSSLEHAKLDWKAFTPSDLDEPKLKQRIENLYLRLKELSPKTTAHIGRYIKANIHDFANVV